MAGRGKKGNEPARGSREELECKLNASNHPQLERTARYIKNNSHYDVIGEEPLSSTRVRIYYDDSQLRAFHAGVEIRVEKKKADLWKITVKTAKDKNGHGNRSGKGGSFRRQEHFAYLGGPAPDLDALPSSIRKTLRTIYDTDDLEDVNLLPLIRIDSRRVRIRYRPGNDKRAVVEYAHDIARARTCTGAEWDLFQAELETKKGNPSLTAEKRRLMKAFNFLTSGTSSKPTHGFNILAGQLASREARQYLRDHLTAGQFRTLPRFSARFPD